jgi:hypothetical protein
VSAQEAMAMKGAWNAERDSGPYRKMLFEHLAGSAGTRLGADRRLQGRFGGASATGAGYGLDLRRIC